MRMNKNFNRSFLQMIICLAAMHGHSVSALAQYQVGWSTIDAGGVMHSAGGNFTLSGTAGQHDAGPVPGWMTGGQFALSGGFWITPGAACTCLGDMNGDGLRDGADIQQFVECLTAVGQTCSCADVAEPAGLDLLDVSLFVSDLLNNEPCL